LATVFRSLHVIPSHLVFADMVSLWLGTTGDEYGFAAV